MLLVVHKLYHHKHRLKLSTQFSTRSISYICVLFLCMYWQQSFVNLSTVGLSFAIVAWLMACKHSNQWQNCSDLNDRRLCLLFSKAHTINTCIQKMDQPYISTTKWSQLQNLENQLFSIDAKVFLSQILEFKLRYLKLHQLSFYYAINY